MCGLRTGQMRQPRGVLDGAQEVGVVPSAAVVTRLDLRGRLAPGPHRSHREPQLTSSCGLSDTPQVALSSEFGFGTFVRQTQLDSEAVRMAPIEFRLLGPFEVRRQGRLVADGGGKRQSLLALLLLSANRIVTTDVLTTAMWGEHAPRSATNLVQGYVSYWRNALDPHREHRVSGDRLTSATGGYCLRVAVEECDLLRFRAHAVEGRRAVALDQPYDARRLLRAAISERRGPALAAFDGPVFAEAARAFDDEWLSLVEIAADVELRLGRPGSALALVDIPSEENPLRESLVARRALALYRSGRQADALEAIERTRRELSEELGV